MTEILILFAKTTSPISVDYHVPPLQAQRTKEASLRSAKRRHTQSGRFETMGATGIGRWEEQLIRSTHPVCLAVQCGRGCPPCVSAVLPDTRFCSRPCGSGTAGLQCTHFCSVRCSSVLCVPVGKSPAVVQLVCCGQGHESSLKLASKSSPMTRQLKPELSYTESTEVWPTEC